jgi:short-subunit dehydrogenase
VSGDGEGLFRGTRALVTGASSGLGEELARQLAARGCALVLTARSEGKLRALADALASKHGVTVEVIARDLAAPGGATALADEIERRGLRIDHLMSNAGFGTNGAIVDSDAGRQAEMVRLNCEALVVLTTRFLPAMVARGAGGIIHVASIAGNQPIPYMATYGATKAFVLSFSLAVAEEVRARGVRVLALCPGPVPTGFQAVAGAEIAPSQRRAILSAEETVRRGLRAYERGQTVCVPGGLNKLGAFGSRLLPRALVVRTVGRMMRQKPRSGSNTR